MQDKSQLSQTNPRDEMRHGRHIANKDGCCDKMTTVVGRATTFVTIGVPKQKNRLSLE